jgi:hypothetical protein
LFGSKEVEGRGEILMKWRGGKEREKKILIFYMFGLKEGSGEILIANVFGSRREGRDDKIKLLF